MVDKLGPLSQIMLRLQQQAKKPAVQEGGKTGRGTIKPAAAGKADGESRPAPLPGTASRPSLEERVLQRLAAMDPEDPRRRQRAFKAFVEVRLLNAFGEQLGNDAGFHQLVEDVSNAMQGDAELTREIEEATDLLLKKQG